MDSDKTNKNSSASGTIDMKTKDASTGSNVKVLKPLIFFLSKVTGILPRRIALLFASLFARFIYTLSLFSPYRNFLFNNIRTTLPLSDKGSKEVAKRFVIKFVKNITDFMRLDKLNDDLFDKIFVTKNLECFEEALSNNKGVILVSAHYGCWELIGTYIGRRLKKKLDIIVQKPSVSEFDELFTGFRKKAGINTYYNNGFNSLKKMLQTLENNGCIGLLIDQHGESEDTLGYFFGNVVSIPSGAAYFSYKTGAPIVPVFIKRIKKEKHEITFYPAIYTKQEEKETEIYKTSQELYQLIEKVIKNSPDEWLWFYERWNKLSLPVREIADNMIKFKRKELST